MRKNTRLGAVAAAGAGLVAAGAVAIATLTGGLPSLDLTYSKGECKGGMTSLFCVDLTAAEAGKHYGTVRITIDCAGQCATNALGCSSGGDNVTIERLEIYVESEDGIKLRGCDGLTVNGGYVLCNGHQPTAHQDGMQALDGSHDHVNNVIFSCTTSNNAQWYLAGKTAGAAANIVDVVCDHCEFHPGGLHSVTIAGSTDSGVTNSLVCPGSAPNLQFDVDPTLAVRPVDVGNYKAPHTSKTWPYSTEPRCAVLGVTEPTDTVPQPTTTAATTTSSPPPTTTQAPPPATTTQAPPATTTSSPPATTSAPATTDVATVTDPQPGASAAAALALIADGFSVLKSKATLYAKWKADNPGESAKLNAYLEHGGAPPKLATATGQALVAFAEARNRLAA